MVKFKTWLIYVTVHSNIPQKQPTARQLMPIHTTSTMSGGTSTATTVPGDDEAALQNAREGTAQVRKRDAELKPKGCDGSSKGTPGVLRVNSVPVLKTPEQRIRKTHTPTEALPDATGSPVAPEESSAAPPEASPSSAAPSSDVSKSDASKPKKDKVKKKRKSKKGKKSKNAKGDSGMRPVPTPQQSAQMPVVSASQAPPAPTAPAVEPSTALSPAERELIDHVAQLGDDDTSPKADAIPAESVPSSSTPAAVACAKPAAKKAAAKKPARDTPPGTVAVKVPVKTDCSSDGPGHTEETMAQEVQQAQEVSTLLRSTTASQFAQSPAPTPPSTPAAPNTAAENKEGDAPDQNDSENDDEDLEEEEEEESNDIEDALDKEAEKGSQPEQQQEAVQGAGNGPGKVKRKRREKTEAEKALHARYMKFSRSLKRCLS